MKKNIKSNMKLISILTGICILIMQTFSGCGTGSSSNKLKMDTVGFLSKNLDTYKSQIKEKTGFECKRTSDDIAKIGDECLEFVVDDTTRIQFDLGTSLRYIEKKTKYRGNPATVKIRLSYRNDENTKVRVNYEGGSTWCDYKMTDFENPISDMGEYKQAHYIITECIKPNELKELCSKAQSIYDKLQEIYNENKPKK